MQVFIRCTCLAAFLFDRSAFVINRVCVTAAEKMEINLSIKLANLTTT